MEDNKAEKIQNLVDSENVKEHKTENLRYRIWESVKKIHMYSWLFIFLVFFCYIHIYCLRAVSNTSIPIMVGIFQLIFLVIVFRPVSDIFLNIISALRGKFDSRLDKSDKKA